MRSCVAGTEGWRQVEEYMYMYYREIRKAIGVERGRREEGMSIEGV